jgi:hypothetical protein
MNGYELSHNWFDFCFENPEKINPSHTAIYFFAIEHCNRMGWKTKFGFPTQMAMDALGISKHSTYIKYFNDLVEWGFLILVQKSSNQYSSKIISLNFAMPKKGKALGKALVKHGEKQSLSEGESTVISDGSIIKQDNLEPNNLEPNNEEQKNSSSSSEENDEEEILSVKLLENLDEKFSVYVYGILKNNSQIEFKEQWQRRKSCYYQLVLNSSHFHKIMKKSNVSKEVYEELLLEFFKHKSTQLDVKWTSILQLIQNAINYINKIIKENGKSKQNNSVAYIQQQQMREPARDFGEL